MVFENEYVDPKSLSEFMSNVLKAMQISKNLQDANQTLEFSFEGMVRLKRLQGIHWF